MKLFLSPLLAVALLLSIFPIGSVRSDPVAFLKDLPESHTELPYVSTEEALKRFPRRGSHPRKVETYLEAELQFPTLHSCLQQDAPRIDQVDLSNFGWSNFHSVLEIDICIFRVASLLGDADEIAKWLSNIGFIGTEVQSQEQVMREHYGYDGTAVIASIPRSDLPQFATRFAAASPLRGHAGQANKISVVIHLSEHEVSEVSLRFSFL